MITMDLHATQNQGFFDIPVDHLLGVPILAEYFQSKHLGGSVTVVSPDHGGVTRARKLAEFLKAPLAIIDKRRTQAECGGSDAYHRESGTADGDYY